MTQIICVISIAVLCAIDQIIKAIVKVHLMPVGSISVIPGILEWKYIENTGAAFGSFSDNTLLLSVFTLVVIIGCFIALLSGKIKKKVYIVFIVMITSGGLSNLLDRMFRSAKFMCGYVIDYINVLFVDFAVFNFADCLITVGCICMLIYALLFDKKDKVNSND